MSLLLALFLMAAGAAFGWLVGYLHNPGPRPRYYSPELHGGRWGWPQMVGFGNQSRVTWEREGEDVWLSDVTSDEHRHEPRRCTIGPGMAHHDECLCGATREGVFGQWSLPLT